MGVVDFSAPVIRSEWELLLAFKLSDKKHAFDEDLSATSARREKRR